MAVWVTAKHNLPQVVDSPDYFLIQVHLDKSALVVDFKRYFLVEVELFAWDTLNSLLQIVKISRVV